MILSSTESSHYKPDIKVTRVVLYVCTDLLFQAVQMEVYSLQLFPLI